MNEQRRFFIWDLWGRETVKDGVLLLIGFPLLGAVLATIAGASSGGNWLAGVYIIAALAVIFVLARWALGAWVAAGERARAIKDEAARPEATTLAGDSAPSARD